MIENEWPDLIGICNQFRYALKYESGAAGRWGDEHKASCRDAPKVGGALTEQGQRACLDFVEPGMECPGLIAILLNPRLAFLDVLRKRSGIR